MTKENEKKGIEQLVFTLGKEEYAVDILKVQEILRFARPHPRIH